MDKHAACCLFGHGRVVNGCGQLLITARRADPVDLRAILHGYRRPARDRVQWKYGGRPSWRLFMAFRLRLALPGSGRSRPWSCW